ncbi:MAG: hypothetical protein KKG59_04730 [Nanoarchaeota archaeon]|nr:hypothetical protein [Nanoarchaeota archaeon]
MARSNGSEEMASQGSKDGQVAMEFIMLLGLSSLLAIGFLAVLNPLVATKSDELKKELFEELSMSIQQEILLAAVAQEGYIREFYIPPPELNHSYERYNYTMELNNSYLVLNDGDQNYYYAIPNISGNLRKGLNVIKNIEGEVHVNP